MNNLTIFKNDRFGEIRTTVKDGEPLFVAADVCKALGLGQVSRAMDRLDGDERVLLKVTHPQNPEKTMEVNGVTEPGLYHLVLCSTKPEAHEFKRWITHDVIPAIRKTGGYVNNAAQFVDNYFPQLRPDQKQAIGMMLDESKRMGEKIAADAPKVLFADAVSTAKTSILVGELAKLLKQNGVEIGQNRLFDWLRNRGYLIRRQGSDYNMPTQKAMEMGLFEIKETSVVHADGHTSISKTPKITGRGQCYFVDKLLGNQLPNFEVGE